MKSTKICDYDISTVKKVYDAILKWADYEGTCAEFLDWFDAAKKTIDKKLMKSAEKPGAREYNLPVYEDLEYQNLIDVLYDNEDSFLIGGNNSKDICKDYFWVDDNNLERGKLYLADIDKPILEKRFTEDDIWSFIAYYKMNEYKGINDETRALIRKFIEERCRKNDVDALQEKGYSCYGGNELYDCDWKMARDCMLKILKLTGHGWAANTLGYIYYYGRCNEGKPQYKEALKYFTLASATGNVEAMYKLGDMYFNGYGTEKSREAAYNLYGQIYDDQKKAFCYGDTYCKFADAALRMGNLRIRDYKEQVEAGDEDDVNPFLIMDAYEYYLQADYAIKLRVKNHDYYGDNVVYNAIQKSIAEAKQLLDENNLKYDKASLTCEDAYGFRYLTAGGRRVKVDVSEMANDKFKFKGTRLVRADEYVAPKSLITVTECGYCTLAYDVTYTFNKVKSLKIKGKDKTSFIFNDYDYEIIGIDEYKMTFTYDGAVTATIVYKDCTFKKPAVKKATGKKVRFASIRFSQEGRLYDYICSNKKITVGSKVIVEGYEGPVEVVVEKIFELEDTETSLPIDRYKKITKLAK